MSNGECVGVRARDRQRDSYGQWESNCAYKVGKTKRESERERM